MIKVPVPDGLKPLFRDALRPNTPGAVSRILMIGALIDNQDGKPVLSQDDQSYLDEAVPVLLDSGVRFSSRPRLLVANCAYDHDILLKPAQAELAIFCNIHFSKIDRPPEYIELRQSPRAHIRGAWHDALMISGAAYAVNAHSNGLNLPTAALTHYPFQQVATHTTPQRQYDVLRRTF